MQVPQQACSDTLRQTCVFTSSGICIPRSPFECVRGMKHPHSILHFKVGLVWMPQKARWGHVMPNFYLCIRWERWVT
jgi:hypothetical protein